MHATLDAVLRLGARPVLLAAWHRSPPGRAVARRKLRDPAGTCIAGPILPARAPPAPAALPHSHRAAVLAGARGAAPPPAGWHGAFPPHAPALSLDLFAHGDIRPVWEANRWAMLPLLAQAARLDPGGGHLPRAETLLRDWAAANPAFRGPNWACGQEAALRALHLALALALLDAGPSAPARALLALHGRRIAATRAYGRAQDNNHAVSEPAGLLACGLLCGEAGWVRAGAASFAAAVLRLVAPCGAFAQPSTGYHRMLLDVVAVAEWLTARLGGPRLSDAARSRLAAAAAWLWRLTGPADGASPRIGHQDGSAFADLSLAGPDDARGSVERAARIFAGHGAGRPIPAARGSACPARAAGSSTPRAGAARVSWAGRRAPRGPCCAPAPRCASAPAMQTCCTWISGQRGAPCCGTGAPAPTTRRPGMPGGTPISAAQRRITASPSTMRSRCAGPGAFSSPTGPGPGCLPAATAPGCATGAATATAGA